MAISSDAGQTCDPNCIHTIVDANDIFKAQADTLGRPPGGEDERIDYLDRLPSLARYPNPENQTNMYSPSLEFFDVQRGLRDGNRFYDLLERAGYELQLTPKGDDQFRVHQDKVIRRLVELNDSCSCPMLFVAGAAWSEHLRSYLLETCVGRVVFLAHFSKLTQFQHHELEPFAGTWDLVEQRVAASRFYEVGDSETHTTRPRSSASPASAGLDETSMSLAWNAAREHAMQLDKQEADGPRPLASDSEPDAALTLARSNAQEDSPEESPVVTTASEDLPQQESGETRGTESDDWLDARNRKWCMLIDVENVDGVLHQLCGATEALSTKERPQWKRLIKWANEELGTEQVLVVPVLQQRSHKIHGFAKYLQAELGFRPRIVEPENGRSVVDEVIMKLLEDMITRDCDVMLISNDGDFFDLLEKLREPKNQPERKIIVAGFKDLINDCYPYAEWIEVLDLEWDMSLFGYQLPNRIPTVQVDEFDAKAFLDSTGFFDDLDAALTSSMSDDFAKGLDSVQPLRLVTEAEPISTPPRKRISCTVPRAQ